MLAIADDHLLYFLDFADRPVVERSLEKLCALTAAVIVPGSAEPLCLIEAELQAYFKGKLQDFKTPLHILGSSFQKSVWSILMQIPYAQTRSYAEQAITLGKPSAARAVANANGANKFSIIIPCHRIINSNGQLGGYGGGVARKQWLLDHEKQHLKV